MIMKNKFIVDIKTTVAFTDAHLEISKQAFNPETHPEYFHLSDKGVEYDDTILMEEDEVNVLANLKMTQAFRLGSNKKFGGVKTSLLKGYDLRAKGIFIVLDKDGNQIALFSGNTSNSILTSHTPLQNRIVHVFRTNSFFSTAKLAQIGGRFNSLDLESDPISWEDVEKIVRTNVEEGEVALVKNPNPAETGIFLAGISEMINYIGDGRFDTQTVKIAGLQNTLLESVTGKSTLITIKNPEQLLTILRTDFPLEFIDGKYNKFVGYSCFSEKILPTLAKAWRKDGYSDKINYDLIIHFGTPSPVDPVGTIRSLFTTFFNEWEEMKDFYEFAYFKSPVEETGRFEIQGFYQPSAELEEQSDGKFPMGSVVSYDDLVKYFGLTYERQVTV
jgi:hypothetical protein|tara:strand:+ start:292 stop:1455 length:1164 start_codon:yes stop_codon:yes gene_type:complete